ncbi:MAG: IPT/TIG domain-containing protein [Thermoanaerobaculia bacterium]|jgi:hypothetical protein
MRRIPFASAALAAGLVVLLTGCAGETPTSPSGSGGGGNSGGACTVTITLAATSQTPLAGTEILVRASVTKAGVAVPDGTSVQLTTDLGLFAENLLQTISKTTVGGAADVTLFSANAGTSHVKATFECASATIPIGWTGSPTGPFVSSYSPQSGSCVGADTVTILGGRFGAAIGNVFFGGAPASIVSWADNTIVVKTPLRTLKDPTKPEVVNLIVSIPGGAATQPVPFTYFCVGNRTSIASISPTAGSPGGGDVVTINGSNFGTNIATTQVTFCGLPAQITGQTDTIITVTTPAHVLANPLQSENCPVIVTRDLGLASVQSATSPVPFVYRGSGANGNCNLDPNFYVSNLSPNTGGPEGGTIVTITGNGFPTNPTLLRVEFGGNPGTVVGTPTSTAFQVSSPRRVLTFPDVPETVDIVVTDLGSASQRCARVAAAFIYTAQALDPSFYSVSPRTGPNDQSTRVTAFGTNFQFPMQVFMTGGTCGAQRVEAAVLSVSSTQIVFNTPVAAGGNSCLAGQLVDIVILNPATGKTASCAACFKYYSCPVAGSASPSVGSATQTTTVVITGNNFAEPVIANFRSASAVAPLQVTSVSNTSIIVTLPSLQTLLGGALTCVDTAGNIELTFPGLACGSQSGTAPTLLVPFTYRNDRPTATSASPTALNQDGTLPSGGQATITVAGTNFQAPMTVTLLKDGSPVPNTPVNNASVSNPTSLSFAAQAVTNGSLNQQNCVIGATVTGIKYVPTSFGIRVTNAITGCSVDLPNVLVYTPLDVTCRAALVITTATLPTGNVTVPYTTTFAAAGGAGGPFTWSVSSGALPAGLSLDPNTGVLAGIPSAAGTSTFTILVTDSAAGTATRAFSLVIN